MTVTAEDTADGLTGFISEAAEKYGLDGNNSLEYIGLTVKNSRLLSKKLYFLPTADIRDMPDWAVTLWDRHYRKLADEADISVCDLSESAYGDIPTYRLVIKFNRLPSVQQAERIADSLAGTAGAAETARMRRFLSVVRRYDGIKDSPLIELGLETDHALRYVSLKYYLTLKPDAAVRPVVTAQTVRLMEEIGTGRDVRIMEGLLRNIGDCGYYPFFIGINDSGDSYESKLYYISGILKKHLPEKAPEQINTVCDALGVSPAHCRVLAEAFAQSHLYPEGIAVSGDNPETVRIYLREIPKRYFR